MFPSASSSVVMNQSGIAGVEPSVGLRICLHIVRSVIDDLAGAEPTSIIPSGESTCCLEIVGSTKRLPSRQ